HLRKIDCHLMYIHCHLLSNSAGLQGHKFHLKWQLRLYVARSHKQRLRGCACARVCVCSDDGVCVCSDEGVCVCVVMMKGCVCVVMKVCGSLLIIRDKLFSLAKIGRAHV